MARNLLIQITLLIIATVYLSYACDEQKCARHVTRCMLMRRCECDLGNCSCCHDCYKCLGDSWLDCCECFGKFQNINATDHQIQREIFF